MARRRKPWAVIRCCGRTWDLETLDRRSLVRHLGRCLVVRNKKTKRVALLHCGKRQYKANVRYRALCQPARSKEAAGVSYLLQARIFREKLSMTA
jgi:hypothetical protein